MIKKRESNMSEKMPYTYIINSSACCGAVKEKM